MSYMKGFAGMRNKEENGGLETSNKRSDCHLSNNCEEDKRDGKIHQYFQVDSLSFDIQHECNV